jgi:hypothetical protein
MVLGIRLTQEKRLRPICLHQNKEILSYFDRNQFLAFVTLGIAVSPLAIRLQLLVEAERDREKDPCSDTSFGLGWLLSESLLP